MTAAAASNSSIWRYLKHRGHCQTIPVPPTTKHKHLQNGTSRILRIGLLLLTTQTGSTELRRHPDAARCTFTKSTPLLVSTPNRTGPTRTCIRSGRILACVHDVYAAAEARSQETMSIPGHRADTRQQAEREAQKIVQKGTLVHICSRNSRLGWNSCIAQRRSNLHEIDGTPFTRTSC
jgi:hypothetical protein